MAQWNEFEATELASYDHRSVMRLDGLVDLVEQISCAPSGKVCRGVTRTGRTLKITDIRSLFQRKERIIYYTAGLSDALIALTVGFAAPRALRPGSSIQ